jgi:hypothetical protein
MGFGNCFREADFPVLIFCGVQPLPQPEGDIHQADESWHFYQWPHDSYKRLPGVQAEDGYSHGDRQFKVVPGSCE